MTIVIISIICILLVLMFLFGSGSTKSTTDQSMKSPAVAFDKPNATTVDKLGDGSVAKIKVAVAVKKPAAKPAQKKVTVKKMVKKSYK